jgi:hypothetical protein
MKSLTRTIAMAAAILATAGVVGANAADQPQQATPATYVTQATSTRTAKQEAGLEWFEDQEAKLDAPSYDPSEHPNAKPAPHSAHPRASVWTNPMNTIELG